LNDLKFNLKNQLPNITKMLAENFEKAILKSSITINNNVKKTLTGTRSGYTYNIPGTGRVVNKQKELPNGRIFYYRKLEGATTWIASAPYEAPAVRLGHLRASYNYQVLKRGFEATGYVGTPIEYSVYLEYGTSRIHPRPHLKVAFEQSKPQIFKYFKDLI
jgi:hypothetical protein